MNFFGHAVLASRKRAEPGFVIGAMLPDFVAMSGARLEEVDRPDIAEGVEFHHRTDAVFHAAPTFRALLARATRELRGRGVHRGGAMGAAHVGIELLLDGALARDERGGRAYLAALAVDVEGVVRWRSGAGGELMPMLALLASRGVPDQRDDAEAVAKRVAIVVCRRPRLALNPDDQRRVRDWLATVSADIHDASPRLMAEVGDGLGTA